ncbi:unnamed protein product [Spodoptera exigua]|nr:unnamed protein product [Spodoptera exigua]
MCNSNTPKREEVIINQNGIGATNVASTEQLQFHVSAISIVMMIILGLLLIVAAYFLYKCYKNCHHQWINDQIVRQYLRNSTYRRSRRETTERKRCPACSSSPGQRRSPHKEDLGSVVIIFKDTIIVKPITNLVATPRITTLAGLPVIVVRVSTVAVAVDVLPKTIPEVSQGNIENAS